MLITIWFTFNALSSAHKNAMLDSNLVALPHDYKALALTPRRINYYDPIANEQIPHKQLCEDIVKHYEDTKASTENDRLKPLAQTAHRCLLSMLLRTELTKGIDCITKNIDEYITKNDVQLNDDDAKELSSNLYIFALSSNNMKLLKTLEQHNAIKPDADLLTNAIKCLLLSFSYKVNAESIEWSLKNGVNVEGKTQTNLSIPWCAYPGDITYNEAATLADVVTKSTLLDCVLKYGRADLIPVLKNHGLVVTDAEWIAKLNDTDTLSSLEYHHSHYFNKVSAILEANPDLDIDEDTANNIADLIEKNRRYHPNLHAIKNRIWKKTSGDRYKYYKSIYSTAAYLGSFIPSLSNQNNRGNMQQ